MYFMSVPKKRKIDVIKDNFKGMKLYQDLQSRSSEDINNYIKTNIEGIIADICISSFYMNFHREIPEYVQDIIITLKDKSLNQKQYSETIDANTFFVDLHMLYACNIIEEYFKENLIVLSDISDVFLYTNTICDLYRTASVNVNKYNQSEYQELNLKLTTQHNLFKCTDIFGFYKDERGVMDVILLKTNNPEELNKIIEEDKNV